MSKQTGFTLIEMMIAVAVIGILAMIALPGYQKYVRDSAVADAKSSLLGLASAMERHRAQRGSYSGAAEDGKNTGAPTVYYQQSPESGAAFFHLTISEADASSYTLTASATTNSPVWNGNGSAPALTVDSLGRKSGTGSLASAWD